MMMPAGGYDAVFDLAINIVAKKKPLGSIFL
jgi:hypothetical protein